MCSLRQVIYQRLLSKKELICVKVVLDIYEHYYIKFDGPLYKNLLSEYIPTALLFYSTLPDEDLLYIYEKLSKDMTKINDILSNNFIF
jgi:hypothetical protein